MTSTDDAREVLAVRAERQRGRSYVVDDDLIDPRGVRDRDRHRARSIAQLEGVSAHRGADALRDLPCALDGRVREEGDELIAGVPDADVVRPDRLAEHARDLAKRLVADVINVGYTRDRPGITESKLYFAVVWLEIGFGSAILLSGVDQPLVLLVIAYVLGRSIGKIGGAFTS